MTYKEICEALRAAGIESAEWDAALLLERFCGVHLGVPTLGDPTDHTDPALMAAVQKRCTRYPLQYLLGEWAFYRQTYEVTPDCLIPRADTEVLVEEAIKLLPQGARFADLCTGSGCIAVSVLCERPDTSAVAVDKFEATLSLAMRNATKNGVQARLVGRVGDVLADGGLAEGERFDAILSNPPYITKAALEALAPELNAEPMAALDGGEDGLLFYRALLRLSRTHLKEGGLLLLEIGYDQAEALRTLTKEAGYASCRILKDLGGNDRVVVVPSQSSAPTK